MTAPPLILGERKAGVDYRLRPSAYAVMFDASGRVALIWTSRHYFLPGGGCEPGETPEETVSRETLEESGHSVAIRSPLGQAIEFFRSREDDLHYEVRGDYYLADLGPRVAPPIEAHHELVWLDGETAARVLHRPGHVWAVRKAIGLTPRE